MPDDSGRLFEFGPFRLDEKERQLTRDGWAVAITPKVFYTLLLLVENSERLVERQAFMDRLWPDTKVEETTLTRNISDLRKALEDGVDGRKFIETISKRGYRLVVPAREIKAEHPRVEPPPPVAAKPRLPAWVFATVAALAAALMLGGLAIKRKEIPIRSIAVLPFREIAPEAGGGHLELGLADAIVTRLSDLPQMTVRPLTAVQDHTASGQDPIETGRKLHVDSVLEGSIQRQMGTVRVRTRLLRVADGTALWSGEFDEPSGSLFEIEEMLSARVAGALAAKLSPAQALRLAHGDTPSPEAHELYAQGRYLWNQRTQADYRKALSYFELAIRADPAYALAYSGMADAHHYLGDVAAARQAANRAIELDPELGEPHATLALITENSEYDWIEAERQYRTAIRKSPGYAPAHHWYGEFLGMMGRFAEGERELALAAEIDPLSAMIAVDTAELAYFERDYDRSIRILRGALDVNPNFRTAHEHIAMAYLMKGMGPEALAEGRLAGNPNLSRPVDTYWTILALRKPEEGAALLREMERAPHPYAFELCEGWLSVGDYAQAMRWLEKAWEEHEGRIISVKVNPELDPLRSQPRFQELLGRMRL
jgi:DNA-binding winged helix-turn-helix (wHTH) protein/TolB-like protein/Tfp pilus assembly protein PilF